MRVTWVRVDARAASDGGPVDLLYLVPEQEEVFGEFPRFRKMWSEEIRLGAEDVGVDEISTELDRCSAFRWTK